LTILSFFLFLSQKLVSLHILSRVVQVINRWFFENYCSRELMFARLQRSHITVPYPVFTLVHKKNILILYLRSLPWLFQISLRKK